MKLLIVISCLGSGGAQRQMVTLAKALKSREHDVEFFIYHPTIDFFCKTLEAAGITIHKHQKRANRFSFETVRALRHLIQTQAYDIALSALDAPNLYLILASMGLRKTRVIVSERSSYLQKHYYGHPFFYWLLQRSLQRSLQWSLQRSLQWSLPDIE